MSVLVVPEYVWTLMHERAEQHVRSRFSTEQGKKSLERVLVEAWVEGYAAALAKGEER